MYLIIPYSKKLRQYKSSTNGIQFVKVFSPIISDDHMSTLNQPCWYWAVKMKSILQYNKLLSAKEKKPLLAHKSTISWWIWPSSYIIRISLTPAHGYILWYTEVVTLKSICIAENINGYFYWMRYNKAGIKTLAVKPLVFQSSKFFLRGNLPNFSLPKFFIIW